MNDTEQRARNNRVLGLLLLAAGAWILAGRFLLVDFGRWLWPFWVIVPGVIITAMGLRSDNRGGEGLVIFGSIVTTTGAVLFAQNLLSHFESWAYAWAVLFPGSIGVGQYLWAKKMNDAPRARDAQHTMRVAAALFLAFGVFFELVLGFSGLHWGPYGRVALGVLLIAGGAAIYVTSTSNERRRAPQPPKPPVPQPPVDDLTPRP
jgi:hypothetical protein